MGQCRETVSSEEPEEWVGADDEGTQFRLAHADKRRIEFGLVCRVDDMHALAKSFCGSPGFGDLPLREGPFWIHEKRDVFRFRYDLLQDCHAFRNQRGA